MIPGVRVTLEKYAPLGDPMELRLHDYQLTLRLADAQQIEIDTDLQSQPDESMELDIEPVDIHYPIEHPGLGEDGPRYHEGESRPRSSRLTFALVGNQNCGKTTLFNQLTGSNQHVGNFPGVTVDRKDGAIKGHPDTVVTDLPGIYSLSPYTSEEVVSRQFILDSATHGAGHPYGSGPQYDGRSEE